MVQPVERGACEYKLSRECSTFNQNSRQIADELADLLGGGHRTLLSILEKNV
jgi:hypothetical protein